VPNNLTLEQILALNPENNVYRGRFEPIKMRNIVFRALIHLNFPDYVSTCDNHAKHQIAAGVFNEIHELGGHFLHENETEIAQEAALKMIKKALKDAGHRAGLTADDLDKAGCGSVSSLSDHSYTSAASSESSLQIPVKEEANVVKKGGQQQGEDLKTRDRLMDEVTRLIPRLPRLQLPQGPPGDQEIHNLK